MKILGMTPKEWQMAINLEKQNREEVDRLKLALEKLVSDADPDAAPDLELKVEKLKLDVELELEMKKKVADAVRANKNKGISKLLMLGIFKKKNIGKSIQIETPPGTMMFRLAKLLVSKKRYERVFEPLAADWLDEYLEALDEKAPRLKFISIHTRNTFYFINETGLLSWYNVISNFIKSFSTKQ